MKLTVTGRNIEITDAMKNHLNCKMDKTFQGMGGITDVHVSLHTEKHRHMAEVTVKTKGFTAHAEEETDDLYITMGSVLGKIEKQMKKHKERSQDNKVKDGFEAKNNLNEYN